MAIPDYQTLMLPVLRVGASGEVSIRDCIARLAEEFKLTEDERAESSMDLLPVGGGRITRWQTGEFLGMPDRSRRAVDVVAWVEETRELLDDLRFTLESDPAAGRQLLRRVLDGPLTVAPSSDAEGRRALTFAGRAGYGQLDLASGAPTVRCAQHEVAGEVGGRAHPRTCPTVVPPEGTDRYRTMVSLPFEGLLPAA